MSKIIYHALFIDDVKNLIDTYQPVHPNIFYHHSTIEFSPKDDSNIEIGKKVKLSILGRITTHEIDALLVRNPKSKNKFAHITLSTVEGIRPSKSNEVFEKNYDLIVLYPVPNIVDTTEGYFDGHNDIKC